MNNKPLISIVTISFNQAEYLEECILSVIEQDYPNIEYIICDPGSTDGSRDIIEKYRDKIAHIIYDKDKGAADGLNNGFKIATGDIYGFINSDDTLLPNAIEVIAESFTENKNMDVVNTSGFFTDANGKRTKHILPSKFSSWLYSYGAVTLFQQGTFFTNRIYKKVGGFNADNKTCWDAELFLDFALANATFKCIYKNTATFRLHEEGISGSGRLIEKYQKDNKRLFEKAMNRGYSSYDKYIRFYARTLKLILNPNIIYLKLFK